MGYSHGSSDSEGGRPFRFQVPTKTVQFLGDEYSGSLYDNAINLCNGDISSYTSSPLLQRRSDGVVYRIKDSDLLLITQIALCIAIATVDMKTLFNRQRWQTYEKHIDGDLLPFILEIIDVRSRHALRCVRQYACIAASSSASCEPGI